LSVRRLVDPTPLSMLCLVNGSHKPLTPLARRTVPLLAALVHELPGRTPPVR